MNQFKPIFLGTVGATEAFASMKRAVDTQKVCCPIDAPIDYHVDLCGSLLTHISVSEPEESTT